MGKKGKIGKDILKKGGVITTKKDSEQYQKFLEEREKKRKQEEIKEKMPDKSPEAKSPAELEDYEEIERLKKEGKLKSKNVHVKEHYRSKPKEEEK